MELVGVVEVEEQVKVVRVLREKEGGLRVLGCGVSPWVVFAFALALFFTPFTSRLHLPPKLSKQHQQLLQKRFWSKSLLLPMLSLNKGMLLLWEGLRERRVSN
jgi:hypothetical protein